MSDSQILWSYPGFPLLPRISKTEAILSAAERIQPSPDSGRIEHNGHMCVRIASFSFCVMSGISSLAFSAEQTGCSLRHSMGESTAHDPKGSELAADPGLPSIKKYVRKSAENQKI